MMILKQAVFMVDAGLIFLLAPWEWMLVLALSTFFAGWFLSYLYTKRLEGDARTLYQRFKRLSDAEKSHVENIFRIAESRIFGGR